MRHCDARAFHTEGLMGHMLRGVVNRLGSIEEYLGRGGTGWLQRNPNRIDAPPCHAHRYDIDASCPRFAVTLECVWFADAFGQKLL